MMKAVNAMYLRPLWQSTEATSPHIPPHSTSMQYTHLYVRVYDTQYSSEYGPEYVLHPEPCELLKRNCNTQEELDAIVESVRGKQSTNTGW